MYISLLMTDIILYCLCFYRDHIFIEIHPCDITDTMYKPERTAYGA